MGGVVVGAAAGSVAGSFGFPRTITESATPVVASKELTCDVLVCGTGLAGLVAANRVLDSGPNLKLLVIEKLPKGFWEPGGDSVIAGGYWGMFGVSPPLPPDAGADALAAAYNSCTGGMAPQELVTAFSQTAGPAWTWFQGVCGVTFAKVASFYQYVPQKPTWGWATTQPGGANDATKYGGKIAANNLEARLLKGGATILYETKAQHLITNAQGQVVGVIARDANGFFNINAKSVVLCTGGWIRDRDMIARYITPAAETFLNACYGNPGTTGDGHKMAIEIGAATRGMGYIYKGLAAWACAFQPYHPLLNLNSNTDGYAPPGIAVDQNGSRFCDESGGSIIISNILTRRPFNKMWCILDSTMYNTLNTKFLDTNMTLFQAFQYYGGEIDQADTITDLANKAGIGGHLVDEVTAYNAAVAAGTTASLPIPRTTTGMLANGPIQPIATPPFYAIPMLAGDTYAAYASIVTDGKCEVMDLDGNVIPGLFAAGTTMKGSIDGGLYPGGTAAYAGGLITALTWGYIAGGSAAGYASSTT